MQQLLERYKFKRTIIHRHFIHAVLFTTVTVFAHLLIPRMLPFLPLVLIFNLLIYKPTIGETREQLVVLWKTLPLAVILAIVIALFLRPFVWTIPIIFLVLMAGYSILQLPRKYVFGGILVLVAYFSNDSWWFYIIVTMDVLVFSLVAWKLSIPFHVRDTDTFKMLHREQVKLFDQLMVQVLENKEIYVSAFFEGYNEMRLLYIDMEQSATLDTESLVAYQKLLYEMEEAYFYLRSLTDAPIKMTTDLLQAYEAAGVKLDVSQMLLGKSPYLFHSKNLLRHYKRWGAQAQALEERGLL